MTTRGLHAAMATLVASLCFACRGSSSSPSSPEEVAQAPAPEEVSSGSLYLSPTGNDSASGRSRNAALSTVARALELVTAGETILLMPGTYVEQVHIAANDARPIEIRGPGAVLDGQRRLAFGLRIVESTDITVEDLEIKNYTDEGLSVIYSRSIVVRNLKVHANGSHSRDPELDGEGFGINVEGSENVILEGNETFANGPEPEIRARGIFGTGINTYGNRDLIIRGNHTHHNVGGGILVEDSWNVLVEDNLIVGNDLDASALGYWDGGLWLDGGHDVIVRANRFEANLGPGIELSDEDEQGPLGYVLEDNVSTGNYFGVYIWNFGVCPFPDERVIRLSGNDFSGNLRQDIWCEER